MLEEILKQLKEKDFSQTEINHALAIILRAWDELEYMKNKDKFQNFELNQHNNFSIMFKDNRLYGKINGQIFEIKDIDTFCIYI